MNTRANGWRSTVALTLALGFALSGATLAQKSYDDHELDDRFYITLGGYRQDDIRTTLRLDAKNPDGSLGLGTVVVLENVFNLDSEASTARMDGWYRFNKKHRLNWSYWKTNRTGVRTYNCDDPPNGPDCLIEIGDITIKDGDTVTTDDDQTVFTLSWTYSFLNTSKYEAWIGIGLNTSSLDYTISTTIGTGGSSQADLNATVPLPVIDYGGRWNFSKRTRLLFTGQVLDLSIGDYSGRISTTRLITEFLIIKNFGIGGGFERHSTEIDAEGDDFTGQLDTGYTAFTLYIKGQF